MSPTPLEAREGVLTPIEAKENTLLYSPGLDIMLKFSTRVLVQFPFYHMGVLLHFEKFAELEVALFAE